VDFTIAPEISPVKAPSASQYKFCAPSLTQLPATTLFTSVKQTNVGQITTSQPSNPPSSFLSPPASSTASATVLYIFQFPAMIFLLIAPLRLCPYLFTPATAATGRLFCLKRSNARQFFSFKKLQRSAATRRYM